MNQMNQMKGQQTMKDQQTQTMKDQQTFRETQRKIAQLQRKIEQLQVKQLFSVTLSDKVTATVNESGSLVISKGSKFTYCGYLSEHYDLNGRFCYRFILDDDLEAGSILVDHEQAKNLKAFIKKLGNFFAKYEGCNTTYTYNNYLSRLNSRLHTDIDFKALDANLKAAGFKVTDF